MKIDDLVTAFLASKTPNTARCYAAAINQFQRQIGRKHYSRATAVDAARFLAGLKARGAADNTIRNRCRSLQSIYSYLLDLGAIRSNPIRAAKRTISWTQQVQVRPTQLIDTGKVRRVIMSIPLDRTGIRDRAIFAMLFGGGLRRSEARLLMVGAVTVCTGVPCLLLAKTKAGKAAKQPMPGWAWEEIGRLVAQRHHEGAGNDDRLFCAYFRKSVRPMSESTFYRVYKQHFRTGCHSARATFATRLLQLGHSDRAVAHALRHAGTTQVAVYDKRRREIADNIGIAANYDDFAVDGFKARA